MPKNRLKQLKPRVPRSETLDEAKLREELTEGYKARYEEDLELLKEWQYVDREGWPEN